jgi:hypothetical protein
MTEYKIILVKSPGITEAERKQRLRQAFDVLLKATKERAAIPDSLYSEAETAAGTAPQERDAQDKL